MVNRRVERLAAFAVSDVKLEPKRGRRAGRGAGARRGHGGRLE